MQPAVDTAAGRPSRLGLLVPDLGLAVSILTLFYCLLIYDGGRKLFRDSEGKMHIRGDRVARQARMNIGTIVEEGHSRIPIYQESVDEVLGILYAKDLLPYLREGAAQLAAFLEERRRGPRPRAEGCRRSSRRRLRFRPMRPKHS